MFRDIKIGIGSIFESFQFIQKHKLYSLFILPAILSLIVLMGSLISIYLLTDSFGNYLIQTISPSFFPEWLTEVLSWGTGFLINIIASSILFTIFRYIAMIILTPVFSYAAQKAEMIITGNDSPFSWKQFIKDIIRATTLALKNLVKQLILIGAFTLLGFIPVIGWFGPILLILVEAYYLGYSTLDYTLEVKKFDARSTNDFVSQNRLLTIIHGLFFLGLLLIPIFGWMFGPIFVVIAGTIAINKKLKYAKPREIISYS